jgi:ABC-type amino acid transport substrate-binding protein
MKKIFENQSIKRIIPFALGALGLLVLAVAFFLYLAYGPMKIRVAISRDDLPFAYQDSATQQMTGMDMDVLNAMAAKENLTFEFIGVKKEELLAAVSSCKYDAGIGLLPIPANPNDKLLYTDPYMQLGQSITVRSGNTEITGSESLAGRQVGVRIGSKVAQELGSAPNIVIVPYETVDQMFQSLLKGNLQAVVSDNTIAVLYVSESKGALKSVGKTFNEENIGIAVCPSANNVRDRINRGLANLKADGRIELLFTEWLSGKR